MSPAVGQVLTCASTGRSLTLTQQIASSGEGTVWETSLSGYLAKLYHDPTPERLQKLRVMVAYPPHDPMQKVNHISFAWPQELLCNRQGQEVGFLMPTIKNSVKLSSIYNPRLRNRKAPRFNWYYLHTTALNIASVIESIHKKGYVVGDIKPQNLLVNNRALVSVIDTDSFQIKDPQTGRVYRCLVGSEGFTPVELMGKDLSSLDQTEVHDRFRLGVLIYLLLFGDHPFKGKWMGGGEPPNPMELIRQGFWPYAPKSLIQEGPSTIPLAVVHPSLQSCFRRCFTDGHHQPHLRPTATEWVQAIRTAIAVLQGCSSQSNHYFNRLYGRCYWCERKAKLGLDVFDLKIPPKPPAKPAVASSRMLSSTALWRPSSMAMIPVTRRKSFYDRNKKELGAAAAFMLAAVCLGLLIAPGDLRQPGVFQNLQHWIMPGSSSNTLAEINSKPNPPAQIPPAEAIRMPSLNRRRAMAISHNGQLLVTGGQDASIQLWDLTRGDLVQTLHGHSDQVIALAISRDGTTLFSSAADGEIMSWNLATGELQAIATESLNSSSSLRSAVIHPGSAMIASSNWAGDINVRDLQTGKSLRSLRDDLGSSPIITVSANGTLLASSSLNGDIKLWALPMGRLVQSFPDLQDWQPMEFTRSLALTPEGKTLASGDQKGLILLRNALTGKVLRPLEGHQGLILSLLISANGQTLVSSSADRTVKIWNLNRGTLVRTLSSPESSMVNLVLSHNGQVLVGVSENQLIHVWQVETGQLLHRLP